MLLKGLRRSVTGIALILAAAHFPGTASALTVSTRYRSPRNPERRIRPSTELIVLHTTEAPARSSLNKLSDRGEAHFCVTESGGVYQIVDRNRVAFHAGRSMWNGREDVDGYSIGIECVGYHNKPMPSVQLKAIRELVKELQRIYRISDERVVCHSHVAYGTPNKWQKRKHRGRKRCGMLFAMPSVRRILDLKSRPGGDADTRSGRLAIGDEYLQGVLYGRTDTMVGRCGPSPAAPSRPVVSMPTKAAAPKTVRAKPTPAPRAHPTVRAKSPVPSGAPKTIADLKARGYVVKGVVSRTKTASRIAGAQWNSSDTYYAIHGKVIPGNVLDAAHIAKGMSVWMRRTPSR